MSTDFVMIRGRRLGELLEVPREDLNSPERLRWWLHVPQKEDPIVAASITDSVWKRYLELTKPVEHSWLNRQRIRLRRKINRLYWQGKISYLVLKFVWRVTPHVGL